jgi:Putative zinc-finger
MKFEINCALVKDLLPSYVDQLTSKETNEIIEEHLNTCDSCKKELDQLVCELKAEKMPQNQDLKRYLNKTKRMYLLKGILLSLGILGVFVCFCVDIAINRKLTWSLIVDMGILFSYAVLYTAILTKKNRVLSTTIVASVLLLPMLWGMQYIINLYFLAQPIDWFNEYALPISLIWIIILNGMVLFYYCSKKIWYTLGVGLFACAAGSILTDAIAEKVSILESLYYGLNWIDTLAYFTCGMLCFIIGYVKNKKQQ